jgi:UDP:flavonoid glycosyltransferase YjiC (YdhE family)
MDISIVAPGSRGDIQPYVALARGFASAGHGVRLVTTRDHAELVRKHGVDPWLADIEVQTQLQAPGMGAALEGGGLLSSFRRFSSIAAEGARLITEQALAASEDADAILTGFGGLFVASSVAEKLRLPLIQAYNVPYTPTAAYPGVLTPWLSFPPRSITHRAGHRFTRQAIWFASRVAGNQARRDVLGLPSARRIGRFDSGILGSAPVFYGLSPAVLARPTDWDRRVHMEGFWFLDTSASWTPPAELEAFIEAGPAPVYIGFGSMSSHDARATARLVLESVTRSGHRAVVHTGWGGLEPDELPSSVVAIGSTPHDWLFPRMAAVVHHGGAGTTAAGIRAGVPSIVVPFHGDQSFWARLVADLGIGPQPIPRKRLTSTRLAEAIDTTLTDRAMGDRASALGTKVRAEDGITAAVRAVTRSLT